MNDIKTTVNRYCYNIGLQEYTIRWLEILCESLDDAKIFVREFYTGTIGKEIHDVFKYRKHILENRSYNFMQFRIDSEKNLHSALEKLCLSPIKKKDLIYFCEQLNNNEFTLQDFFELQAKKPKLNFFRLFRMINNF